MRAQDRHPSKAGMSQPEPQKDPAPSTSTSYVYPVRSLLTGIHAPAPSTPTAQNAHGADHFDKRFSIQDNVNDDDKPCTDQLNFRHYPAEDTEHQSFASQPQGPDSNIDPVPRTIAGPAGEIVSYIPISSDMANEMNSRRPEPISAAGAQALTDGSVFYDGSDSGINTSPGTLASAGLVHLTPIRPNSQPTDRSSAVELSLGEDTYGSQSGSGHVRSVRGPVSPSSGRGSDSQDPQASPVVSNQTSELSTNPEEPHVTFRFQHVQDEHGHHVVVGREGNLTKCEDEPIRVPGAVQGFGVLVALREDSETGNLVVRQVSENATELLGLSPKYLFSLDCFTKILPESQADILWDNVQFLNGSEHEDTDNPQDGPQVFLLSGWGEPGSAISGIDHHLEGQNLERRTWTCWCAAHRPPSDLLVLEFELERDVYNPLYPPYQAEASSSGSSRDSSGAGTSGSSTLGGMSDNSSGSSRIFSETQGESLISQRGLQGDDTWFPSPADILESTTSRAKPIRALERMRRVSRDTGGTAGAGRGSGKRSTRSSGVGTMDVFAVLSQINDQLASAPDLDSFLKVVVGVIKDLTQFHRVLVYQFDEVCNGQVVAELVDWSQTHDLYKGLHFPAADIPAQARALYVVNKVRLLYDRSQTTARLVVRSRDDLDPPLDMTHSYLRAMSPIHVKYLANMGVRASMSISIVTFGVLWGLITCHSYGNHGMRVSFPVRQMLRLLSDSISRNIERLSYAQRLHTRKLISTLPTDSHPTGYIVSNAEDLLSLFDADFGVLVVGEGAKILGANQHGQEILILAEYLRLKQFELMQVSQAVTTDFPDLVLPTGLEVIAGLLYVPLSSGGKDFIALLRKGQMRDVHWAGRPFKEGPSEHEAILEPRKSFKMWSETIVGRCRAWTDEQLETAGVLALVYGKFIEVWRQKETALQTTQLTNLLLSNASHEVRTPLNHIINYLELALDGQLDGETRENLTRSHTASKSLLFTINDLLDLTRLESGNETSFNEPFDLQATIHDAVQLYRIEAARRGLDFRVDLTNSPQFVIGDLMKIRTLVSNLSANAIKYTSEGSITVECHRFLEPPGLRTSQQVAVEIVVADTGCGIPDDKLESMFREFEQVETTETKQNSLPGLGLGLAVVARIVEQLGGQLRVDSKLGQGSRFSFLIPFALHDPSLPRPISSASSTSKASAGNSEGSAASEIESLVEALSTNPMGHISNLTHPRLPQPNDGTFPVVGSKYPVRSIKIDEFELDNPHLSPVGTITQVPEPSPSNASHSNNIDVGKLKVLVVDDDAINRTILSKRLSLDGHTVFGSTNGQEGVRSVELDRTFDCVLMDIQMPILDGFEATKQIRALEKTFPAGGSKLPPRISFTLNGRIPIFAVSASLAERQREDMSKLGFDGWILKPIDFKRLGTILHGITDVSRRDIYYPGCDWEAGGWLSAPQIP